MAETKFNHMTKEIGKLRTGYKERCNYLKLKEEVLRKSEQTCET